MTGEANLKERIRRGDPTIGVSLPMTATKAQIEQIFAKDPAYNFISVDSQHGPLNESNLVSLCTAAQELGIPVHFRIKHTRYAFQVGNWFDLGPTIIEVPQTEEEETVRDAVDFTYYRPQGKRSWGGAARVGSGERSGIPDYTSWWNNFGVLWMQVESIQAICNIPRLAAPGVDCISWGPSDLTIDRNLNPLHPLAVSDDACVEYAVKALAGTGAKLAYRSYDWNLRDRYLGMGAVVLLERPKP
ncbi:MAG: aldolase/citrate lyase family protein [Dehalococcoidia bacterium]